MHRLAVILAATVVALLGSGGLSALHRAAHHGPCGADGHSSRPCPIAVAIVGAGCRSAACGSVDCSVTDILASFGLSSSGLPEEPVEGLPDQPRDCPQSECGFCVLLALSVTTVTAPTPLPSPFAVANAGHRAVDDAAVSRWRVLPHGARPPPVA